MAKPSAAAQPRAGGILNLGQTVEIAAGGQAGTSAVGGTNITPAALSATFLGYDSLVSYDANMKPQPMLAESWDVATDFKRIKLNLRKGVQFHSGRELTSDDVEFTIKKAQEPNFAAQFTNMSKWFTTIEKPDKYTVVLSSDQPRPAMFDLLDMLNIVDKDLVSSPNYATKGGGTGPFKFVEWVQGDHIRWVKNPNYWMSGKPYLDEVNVHFIADAQAMVAQFEAGALQAMDSPPLRDATRLQQNPKYKMLVNDQSGQYWIVVANTTAGPTANKGVRQALNYAIDRKRFINTALSNIGQPEDLPWLPSSPAYDTAKQSAYAFDLDKAKDALTKSGVSAVAFDFLFVSSVPEIATFAQLYQADLAKIGIKMTIKGVERGAFNDLSARFQFGLLMSSSGFANYDAATLPLVSRYWDINNNLAGFNKSDPFKQLVGNVSVEGDPAKRKAILGQLNDLILDESFSIPVAPAKHVTVVTDKVNGFGWKAVESVDYANVWLSA